MYFRLLQLLYIHATFNLLLLPKESFKVNPNYAKIVINLVSPPFFCIQAA